MTNDVKQSTAIQQTCVKTCKTEHQKSTWLFTLFFGRSYNCSFISSTLPLTSLHQRQQQKTNVKSRPAQIMSHFTVWSTTLERQRY